MEIYFDNSATTQVAESAVAAMVKAMRQEYGNPSSLHRRGLTAEKLLTLYQPREISRLLTSSA